MFVASATIAGENLVLSCWSRVHALHTISMLRKKCFVMQNEETGYQGQSFGSMKLCESTGTRML